jgi:hypothetical protein
MTTVSEIEDLVVDFIMNNNQMPKYVLMDKKSFQELNDNLRAMPRFDEYGDEDKSEPKANVKRVHVAQYELEFLEINTDKTIIEIV